MAKKRQEELYRDSPGITCLPPGPMVDMGVGRVVQTPKMLVMLFGSTLYREMFFDGRPLPEILNPSWMGYSVGHWDGDTLLIESAGFNDRTWLDGEGHPHTESLRVTERLRRPDFGQLGLRKPCLGWFMQSSEELVQGQAFVPVWSAIGFAAHDTWLHSIRFLCPRTGVRV